MSEQQFRRSARAKLMPILTLVSACLFAAAGPFVLGLFAEIAAHHDAAVNSWTLFILDHRWWMIAVVLPAILISLAALFARSSFSRIGLAMLSGLSLAAAVLIIMYVAISVVAPLYEYRAL